MKKANTTEYVWAIKEMIKRVGIDATNNANHRALETGLITLEEFQAAARVLVEAFLDR